MGAGSVPKGRQAEDSAAQLLSEKGYRLLERNFRCRRGEIDLIVTDGELIVFVEVRCRIRGTDDALLSITREKCRRLIMTANYYLALHPSPAPCRFDIIAVAGNPAQPTSLRHWEAAFNVGDI